MVMSAARQTLEPVLRRIFHLYWRFSRGMTLGVRGLVVDAQGRVFLVKHSYVSGWHLPGGGVEPGETIRQALERELREEGNIELTDDPLFHGLYFNRHVSDRDHVALFIVRAFRQSAPPQPDREIIAHGFYAPDRLPEGTSRATRARISEALAGTPVQDRW
ncbi:MAG: NUDIX domain-containing protein [Xanthobacteraceae bacterium]|nr:NUDIX domain-containing protein [Xanthobacteraceae bacterium]